MLHMIWTTRCCQKWREWKKILVSPNTSKEKHIWFELSVPSENERGDMGFLFLLTTVKKIHVLKQHQEPHELTNMRNPSCVVSFRWKVSGGVQDLWRPMPQTTTIWTFGMVFVHPCMMMLEMVKPVLVWPHSSDLHHQTIKVSSIKGWKMTEVVSDARVWTILEMMNVPAGLPFELFSFWQNSTRNLSMFQLFDFSTFQSWKWWNPSSTFRLFRFSNFKMKPFHFSTFRNWKWYPSTFRK